jgi:hypothetical protein
LTEPLELTFVLPFPASIAAIRVSSLNITAPRRALCVAFRWLALRFISFASWAPRIASSIALISGVNPETADSAVEQVLSAYKDCRRVVEQKLVSCLRCRGLRRSSHGTASWRRSTLTNSPRACACRLRVNGISALPIVFARGQDHGYVE